MTDPSSENLLAEDNPSDLKLTLRGSSNADLAKTSALVGRTVADVERDLILETLKHRLGNRTHAANILGISIRTLRNKLNEYAIAGVRIPPPGGAMHIVHQGQPAHAPDSNRRARIPQRGERRHAVL
jgi:hypothetical protein